MSLDMTSSISPERVCYVHCNFCNTILAVSVPCSSIFALVTVRCGHCANLLSVSMQSSLEALPLQDPQKQQRQQSNVENASKACRSSSSSKCNRFPAIDYSPQNEPRITPIRLGTFPSYPLWTQAGGQQAKPNWTTQLQERVLINLLVFTKIKT